MIRLDIQQAVATLTFDRPEKLNAITPEMGEALRAHVTAINANTDIRAVVLTGAGAKSFSPRPMPASVRPRSSSGGSAAAG